MRTLHAPPYPPARPLCRGEQVYVMGDVGIEEELDLIGVPHFGGPKVTGMSLLSGCCCTAVCRAHVLLLSCCCRFRVISNRRSSYFLVGAFSQGLRVQALQPRFLCFLFLISNVGVVELRQAPGRRKRVYRNSAPERNPRAVSF